jgi:hypothetical protein
LGQVEDPHRPAGINGASQGATTGQFRIIAVRGNRQQVEGRHGGRWTRHGACAKNS